MDKYKRTVSSLKENPCTWLVTGGAGFIGSNLVERLLELGQTVRVLDNLSTGYARNINDVIDTIGLVKSSHLDFIQGDIRDLEDCKRACEGADYVLHEAAQVSVPLSLEKPLYNNDVNTSGFLNMLFAARDKQVKSFVYASSSAVYGDGPTQPKIEDMACDPISPYGLTKLIDEQYAALSNRIYGFPTVGLRYFNAFGPRQDPRGTYAGVIPKWISALLAGQMAVIYGDGEQSRDFCHIENIIQANLLAACNTDPAISGKVFNIGLGRSTTINELYEVVKHSLAAVHPEINGSGPIYDETRYGDIKYSEADITLARELLGYEPTHDLKQGLEESLHWYIHNLS